MKKVFAVGALIAALTLTIQPATATVPAPEPTATVTPTESPITAPDVPITFPSSTFPSSAATTEPSAAPTAIPTAIPTAPAEAPPAPLPTATEVPAEPVAPVDVPAPVDAPAVVADPIMEDDPRVDWNCETMGNKVCGPGAGESIDSWLTRTCFGPILHKTEYIGVMRTCKYNEAISFKPEGFTWIGTGPQADTCATYVVVSSKYADTIHSYKDPAIQSSYEPCNFIPDRPTVQ